MNEFEYKSRSFISGVRHNWILSGALIGLGGAAVKSLLDSLANRTGLSGIRATEVTQRAVFGKQAKSPMNMVKPRRRAGRTLMKVAVEALMGAGLGAGISTMASRSRPRRSMMTGALIGAGMGALTLGVAGLRRTGVFTGSPYRTAGRMLLTSGIAGALTAWTISRFTNPYAALMERAELNLPFEPVVDEPPAEFVH